MAKITVNIKQTENHNPNRTKMILENMVKMLKGYDVAYVSINHNYGFWYLSFETDRHYPISHHNWHLTGQQGFQSLRELVKFLEGFQLVYEMI